MDQESSPCPLRSNQSEALICQGLQASERPHNQTYLTVLRSGKGDGAIKHRNVESEQHRGLTSAPSECSASVSFGFVPAEIELMHIVPSVHQQGRVRLLQVKVIGGVVRHRSRKIAPGGVDQVPERSFVAANS